jgi:nitrile hydratase beta subunit
MNGIHDMGGMHGFGPVHAEEDEPTFHEVWEGRVYGLVMDLAFRGVFASTAVVRFAIESIEPVDYLSLSYYQKWFLAAENILIKNGSLTAGELDAKTDFFRQHPAAVPEQREDREHFKQVMAAHSGPQPLHWEVGIAPKFDVGAVVRVRNINPIGHTRLPRYVRGKQGVVDRIHGVHTFDDTLPQDAASGPQPVYNVRFQAQELWGNAAVAQDSLYIDMWESYLEPI